MVKLKLSPKIQIFENSQNIFIKNHFFFNFWIFRVKINIETKWQFKRLKLSKMPK